MLARTFEEAGMSTTGIVLITEHAQRVKPPRMLSVPFFFGNALGAADDPDYQHQVLEQAFALLDRERGPVLQELPDEMVPEILIQASETTPKAAKEAPDPADEVTALRAYYERWVEKHGGRTAVGLTGIPQRRFRGIIRFFQGYIAGEMQDMDERPTETALPQFIRYCTDDLKAFYYEARMEQRPDTPDSAVHSWFWTETSMGELVVKLSAYMGSSEDDEVKSIAFGLSR